MKLKFYEVDSEYIEFLRKNGDEKIPNIAYEKHKKFFCGILLTINICDFKKLEEQCLRYTNLNSK